MEHEVWDGGRYLFTCGWNEDPWQAVEYMPTAKVVRVQNGVRTEL